MTTRMTLATGMAALALTVAACGTGGDEPDPGATTTAPPSATPEPTSEPTPGETPEIASAEDLVGEWNAPEAEWTVRFEEDGTFTEDFQGIADFRTGDYEYADGIVTLRGGDGNNLNGEVDGTSIVFRLGTLTRP